MKADGHGSDVSGANESSVDEHRSEGGESSSVSFPSDCDMSSCGESSPSSSSSSNNNSWNSGLKSSRWGGRGTAIGERIRKPTAHRVTARPAALQRPDVNVAFRYEVTPAQAAAAGAEAEADRLNTLMQACRPRPPPHLLPSSTVQLSRDHRVEARAQGTLYQKKMASNTGATTTTASATMISTPTKSSSSNSRASSLTPRAKSRRWYLTRVGFSDSSKKMERQPSRDSNGTSTSAAGEAVAVAAAAAAEECGSSDESKKSVIVDQGTGGVYSLCITPFFVVTKSCTKILILPKILPTRFCFTFYGDKILYKIFPRFSHGRKCALLAKS